MKIKAEMGRKRAPLWPHEYQVDKVVELPNTAFASFMIQPLDHYDFIERNRVEPHQGTGLNHCLLLLGDDRTDGALVQCGDDGRAMYAAYVAGARDIVNAELNRAVDLIIREGTENTSGGNWCVYFDELERRFGLTIREGNGLDGMLLDAMRSRPEVADVALANGCVDTVYYLAYCKNLDDQEGGTDAFSPERASELLDNAVSAVCELYEGGELYAMLHDSFGLTIREIREHGILSDQDISDICHVPQQVLDGGMTVRDALGLDDLPDCAALIHRCSTVLVPLEDLKELTPSGQEDFTALLDAQVADIRVNEGAPELVLEGVEAAELERFCDAFQAHKQAEWAMGDMTP
jgi:hypothetical protein